MHEHDGVNTEGSLRPKSARLETPSPTTRWQAAAEGRTDVLDPAGVLGLQRAVGNAGVSSLMEQERSPVHDVIGSSGSPLAPEVQRDMQSRLGHDFSDVRVHTGGAAHQSAQSVNAQAYTVGSNVVFQDGKYDPSSAGGKQMLAHELTHVVQQRSGPVDGTESGGGVKVSDPSDRFEREASATAEAAMSAGHVAAPAASASAVQRMVDGDGPQVQRAGPEEEEPEEVQTYVQRAEGEEEEEMA